MGKRDGLVGLPILSSLCIIDEDDEVFIFTFVVDLGLDCFSASHDCDVCVVGVGGRVVSAAVILRRADCDGQYLPIEPRVNGFKVLEGSGVVL